MTTKSTHRNARPAPKRTVLLLVAAALACAAVAATESGRLAQSAPSVYAESRMISPDTATPAVDSREAKEATIGSIAPGAITRSPVLEPYRSTAQAREVEDPNATD